MGNVALKVAPTDKGCIHAEIKSYSVLTSHDINEVRSHYTDTALIDVWQSLPHREPYCCEMEMVLYCNQRPLLSDPRQSWSQNLMHLS